MELKDSKEYSNLYRYLFSNIDVGLVAIDKDLVVGAWNGFMANHSGLQPSQIVGKKLTDIFQYIPESWIKRKVKNIFLLKTPAYTSWKERPYVFQFKHNRQITSSIEFMFQDTTFLPVKNSDGKVVAVAITVYDMTDVGIFRDKLKKAGDMIVSLEEKVQVDGLTQVYNRMALDVAMETEFDYAELHGGALSYLLIDLDHFKAVNDTYGHQAGDKVLRVLSNIAKSCVRTKDVIGRYGGEEFAIILPGVEMEMAEKLAERIRVKISETPVDYDGIEITITASIGLAEYNKEMSEPAQMIKLADEALYYSKENGRNCVTCSNR